VQVGSSNNWKSIAVAVQSNAALKTDGTLWSWGQNSSGTLGLGDITNQSSPIQVGALTNWKLVSSSNYAIIAIQDGYI
jgi:alpha-tubulin suppressor-like RCC1 family protein